MENESIRSEPNARSRRSKSSNHHSQQPLQTPQSNHIIGHHNHNSSNNHHHHNNIGSIHHSNTLGHNHSSSSNHHSSQLPPPLPLPPSSASTSALNNNAAAAAGGSSTGNNSNANNTPSHHLPSAVASSAGPSSSSTVHHRDRSTRHSHRSNHSRKRPDMAPFQTSVNLEDARDGQEIIEVQILPQDDNWGENTTAITGNTSEQSLSMEDVSNWPMAGGDGGLRLSCQRAVESAMALALTAAAFFSPLAMVVLPKLGFFAAAFERAELAGATGLGRPLAQQLLACNAECKGGLVSLAARMVLLALGLWALFLRQPVATMPRIFLFRATALLLVLLTTFAYWLFYVVQVREYRIFLNLCIFHNNRD